jgi:hypothetical protein
MAQITSLANGDISNNLLDGGQINRLSSSQGPWAFCGGSWPELLYPYFLFS